MRAEIAQYHIRDGRRINSGWSNFTLIWSNDSMLLQHLYRVLLRMPRFRGQSRLASLLRRQLAPPIADVQGVKMELDSQEWCQIDLLSKGVLEPQTTLLMQQILRPGDVYFDVGAHVGYHALVARKIVGPAGSVVALEPQPYNCNKLLINASLNNFTNVMVVVGAAGEQDGVVQLAQQAATDKSRLTLMGPGVADTDILFEVPMWRLDTLCERRSLRPPRLLKIDVEGYEWPVLRGTAGILSKIEHVIFEVLAETPMETTRGICDLLALHGFSMFDVEGKPWNCGDGVPENNVWARRVSITA